MKYQKQIRCLVYKSILKLLDTKIKKKKKIFHTLEYIGRKHTLQLIFLKLNLYVAKRDITNNSFATKGEKNQVSANLSFRPEPPPFSSSPVRERQRSHA